MNRCFDLILLSSVSQQYLLKFEFEIQSLFPLFLRFRPSHLAQEHFQNWWIAFEEWL